jgi:hypothetical protein
MAKGSRAKAEPARQSRILKGWKEIAEFLGEPMAVVKRWREEGMPVVEEGRFVTSSPEQLSAWLGQESGKPVHVVAPDTDLASELRRGVAFARRRLKSRRSQ